MDSDNAGIYVVGGACGEQYTGKTTTTFMKRIKKHLISNDLRYLHIESNASLQKYKIVIFL